MNVFAATGRLGRDAEVRVTQSGAAVANLDIAVDAGYGDRKSTLWLRASLFGKRAEGGLIQYLTKGKQVAVSGELSMSNFQKKDGSQGYSLDLRIAEIDLIGGQQGAPQNPNNGGGYGQNYPPQGAPHNQQQQQTNQHAHQSGGTAAPQHGAPQGFDDFNDEIPF